MPIEVLARETSSLLLAHQVLPDPYILLKELIENSIDAGATSILLSICGSIDGLTYSIQDNGCGIEINKNFLMEGGSSKSTKETYGCKGIALHSLIQLCDATINTKRDKDIYSIEVVSKNGNIERKNGFRSETGTTICLSNFHKKNPVRYKHIFKNLSLYIKQIIVMAKSYCVAHDVSICIERNGKSIFSYHFLPDFRISEKITRVFGVTEGFGMFKVENEMFILEAVLSSGLGAEGVMVSKNKLIESPKIHASIVGLSKLLSKKIIYHMEILQEHPEEKNIYYNLGVRSNKHARLVYKETLLVQKLDALKESKEVEKTLQTSFSLLGINYFIQKNEIKYIFTISTEKQEDIIPAEEQENNTESSAYPKKRKHPLVYSIDKNALPDSQDSSFISTQNQISQENTRYLQEKEQAREVFCLDKNENLHKKQFTESFSLNKNDLKNLQVIGQFNNGFIISSLKRENETLFYAVDQHSADEAVNYERMKSSYSYKKQKLLKPSYLSLTEYERYFIEENKKLIESHGFLLSDDLSFLLEVPFYEDILFGEKELKELIEQAKENPNTKLLFTSLRRLIATKACRSSIMIGESLSKRQMQDIIDNLSTTTRPWNCPHGRPTIILLQKNDSQINKTANISYNHSCKH
ncbi:DNA mismatch repair protein PMS2 [Nematocida sp. LUAm1]|nr:DNA mismatch repair protein PMS2 [Nematocida sp. LUAm2]KAI5179002.1 DNA mismatch repair protein PMS2 [Nematocida sp. LUAm1]